MTVANKLHNAIDKIFKEGKQVSLSVYSLTPTSGLSVYDDDVTFSLSGTALWMSGLVFPINSKEGSSEALLLEQGKLLSDDKKIYIKNNTIFSGTTVIGIGSPSNTPYQLLKDGLQVYTIGNTIIYQKIYCRHLAGGSIY